MMKSALSLCFLATLPCVAQAATDVSTFPVAELTGWGQILIPVPTGYEATCFKEGDSFRFSLAKPKQPAALVIFNGFSPAAAEEGERCYAEIAGKRRKGFIVTQADGTKAHEFLLEDGPAGSVYVVTLPASEDAALMLAVMEAMQFPKAEDTNSSPIKEPASTETKTFRAKGSFTMAVPTDLRVVETKEGDAYFFHFLNAKGDRVMSIYSGYAPAVQTGGKSCTAVIAGKKEEGTQLTGDLEPSAAMLSPAPGKTPRDGEEYVIPGGAEGALYHITLYDTPHRAQLAGVLAGMHFSGGSPLPAAAAEKSAALRASAEACVQQANMILSAVKDRAGADAAVAQLRPLADTMQANNKAAAALQQRYGRALHAYLHAPDKPNSELSPTTKQRKDAPENEIQRVHEADCYGSEALEEMLLRFMGIGD